MTLGELLEGVALRHELPSGAAGLQVAGLDYDSHRVSKGFIFFAIVGTKVDGGRYVRDVLNQGASAVVSEQSRPAGFDGAWVEVERPRQALAIASRNFYGKPDQRLRFSGITGTNGKTTTSYLLESILREAGYTTGLIGTIQYRMGGKVYPAPNTTPESLDFMRFAAELETIKGQHLIAEVSSHGLALDRVYGFEFHTAVFTNLTRDHLDFHGSMEEYASAKRRLFAPEGAPAPKWAVLNADDPFSATVRPSIHTVSYGMGKGAGLRAEKISSGFGGLRFDLLWEGQRQQIESPLVGRINVSNILAASGAAISHGVDLAAIARGVAACKAVPGRFERVDAGQPFLVVVDYAHTDDALRNAIHIARELASERVITLFGCGGDRDRSKRPLMGMAAAELSDFVVLTSDNPRSEDPIAIMNDALVGLRRFDTPHAIEPDRGRAIRIALEQAKAGDVVLLAGKGHETYQLFKDRTVHFDDREAAREALKTFGYKK